MWTVGEQMWTDDQNTLYDYDVEMLTVLSPSGVLSTDQPSPLTRDEIVPVLEKIAKHSNYQRQTIICHDKGFEPVVLQNGEVMS